MSATLDLHADGTHTLSIPAADGELVAYRIAPAPRGVSTLAIYLERLDSGDTYEVRLYTDGPGTCDCPSETYRKRGKPHCKHLECAKSLAGFLRLLTAPPAPRRQPGPTLPPVSRETPAPAKQTAPVLPPARVA